MNSVNNQIDDEYFRLLRIILSKGREKKNRTGMDTIGVFGEQAKFDVRMDSFPVLTTKRIHFKSIVHELLWFIKGDTNIKYLVDNDVHIWDAWAYKRYKDTPLEELKMHEFLNVVRRHFTQDEFIKQIKDCPPYGKHSSWEKARFAIEWGELGEGTYGGMWRSFPYLHKELVAFDTFPDTTFCKEEYFDQIQKVIDKLKTDPDDRRMIVSAWHPYLVDHCALPPCHCLFHFNTEELTHEERVEIVRQRNPDVSSWDGMGGIGSLEVVAKEPGWLDHGGMGIKSDPVPKRKLNLLLYQRSCDTFIGVPFNITSYSLLLAMVAHCVGMQPGTFTHTYGDLHIYENHMDQVNLQLNRTPKVLPTLWLNPNKKDLFEFKYEDIKLEGYNPHPTIKAPIAV